MPHELAPCSPKQPTRPILRLDWRAGLRAGDIVSFRFPFADESEGQPKARPCLILEVWWLGQQRFARVAFGTTSTSRLDPRQLLDLKDPAQVLKAGLHKPTRFLLDREITVPLCDPSFRIARRVWCRRGQNSTLRRFDHLLGHLYSPVSRMWAHPRGEICARRSGKQFNPSRRRLATA